ncbi:MAG: type II toxin-antitoxin system VapC family toxin [Chloroflexi bacterium]|nr:type II toxin-antitoxin system VapC family toxin [Chloroflexota bacterium]
MIVLDTHIWIWWVHGDERLTQAQRDAITTNETDVIGVGAISCWEIAIESTRLPGEFHRDPADQMIVATARVYGCPLVTSDDKILNYAHVRTIR